MSPLGAMQKDHEVNYLEAWEGNEGREGGEVMNN